MTKKKIPQMEWIEISCPMCGQPTKIKRISHCEICGLSIELDQSKTSLGLAEKIKIICE